MQILRNILTAVLCLLTLQTISGATTARNVLDKAAKAVSNAGGVSARFTLTGQKLGNMSGTISVKGSKFHASTPNVLIWFDGKTQWTYMKNTEEVNVSNPTPAQAQSLNPYNFITMYRTGFTYTMESKADSYVVHLKATDTKRSVKEMYITVSKSDYTPRQVRMLQAGGWTTVTISNLQKKSLSDSFFRFNPKSYPQAELIDLR